MKRKKAALYDPYLDIMGGGERHVLSIMKALEDAGYEITIFWDINVNESIQGKLNIPFTYPPQYHKNIFKNDSSLIQKLQTLQQFDVFVYVTDGSYFFSTAKRNIAFCMVPQKDLYNMTFANKLKTINYQFISNSLFTQGFLKNWGINSTVVYPCLDSDFINLRDQDLKKENIILSVGRFFKHLHAKRQDVIISTFKELKEKNKDLQKFKLVLAGSLKDEDKEYFAELEKLAGDDDSIELLPNINFEELLKLYKKSLFYWHFAGYGVNEQKHPEQVEHLGITPLEAMAAGCITFCYRAGGPKELITNGENGFLFSSTEELEQELHKIMGNKAQQEQIKGNALNFVHKYFRYESLQKRVWETLSIHESFTPPVEIFE